MAGVNEQTLTEQLTRWAREQYCAQARATDVQALPGNAGLSFAFNVLLPGEQPQRLVIRLAPPGVRRRGNTDVLRQVPLLDALGAAGIPVARVRWSTADERLFGTDAVIQEFVPARPLHMTEAHLSAPVVDGDMSPMLAQAIAVLAKIHALDWERCMVGWEQEKTLAAEVEFWSALLDKAPESSWQESGRSLSQALLQTAPVQLPVGLFHGDFQTNNVLFADDGQLKAVVDWEIAGIGPQLLDVGWLSMFLDPTCWGAERAAEMRVVADPDWISREYERQSGAPVQDFGWYRALACFRFGVIAAFNVRLHREGKRVDETYETLAGSIPVLFASGLRLCHERR